MNREVMFSSATAEWATPQGFFDELNKEFNFTLDPAADETNHKCETFFTKEQNGLTCPKGLPNKNRRRVFPFLQSARLQRVRGQEGLRHDILQIRKGADIG